MVDRETEQWIVNELRSIQSNMTRKEYNKMIERFVTAHRDNALQYLLDPAHPERAIFLNKAINYIRKEAVGMDLEHIEDDYMEFDDLLDDALALLADECARQILNQREHTL